MTDPIRCGYADTAAGQLHFRCVAGPTSHASPTVLLLHRTPASSRCFEPMLRHLAGRRAAVALDTPGFGNSFCPVGQPGTADYARWFLAALDVLELDTVHVCAHHTGTHFGVELARLAPQRVRSLLLSGVLYADADERAAMHLQIGNAQRPDAEGRYLADTWAVMRSLFPVFDADLVHAELLGALASLNGRDQAFGAILAQDFAAVLADVIAQGACPVQIVQAEDDPLAPMLARVRAAHPTLPIDLIGPAFLAAPERQSVAFARALLAFASQHDLQPTR